MKEQSVYQRKLEIMDHMEEEKKFKLHLAMEKKN
jgi:hypothetical protein